MNDQSPAFGGRPMGVGVIGCGNISGSYLSLAPLFRGIEFRAVADLDPAAAAAKAALHGLRAETVEGLLAAPDVDIVLNLTVPSAHREVTAAILEAGKHAYSEKPLALSLEEGQALATIAARTGRRVGSAPDTFLGAAHQTARRLVDEGAAGRIVHGTAHFLSPGMEHWHPNPGFFYGAGGGPVLDMGPYHVALIVNLLGPVARVAGMSATASGTRAVTAPGAAVRSVPVEVPTTHHALLEFASGAVVTLGASWDAHAHGHRHLELYGTEGTLVPQDPNFFGGAVEVHGRDGRPRRHEGEGHPLSVRNRVQPGGHRLADYRGIGLADMAAAIREGREARCGLAFALHVTEVLDAVIRSGRERRFVEMATTCPRPEALGPEEARALLAGEPVPA
ncbi:putative dehydrogenase [Hasllibacter halocynthiae]|uniref:Putative dehydrogenase n=1 Tax=Hasllibacter halocynthiae TaxID=595589 RepID=A0A2T0X286_9RHOB|nr:Gfo/Idh/MocA family oxidoreductase [Hasllibacter halocynthiae]PRY93062.1 putative dehydrogenase [Hasllibacter halocynthiae]